MIDKDPRERDPTYLGWIAKLPCAACLVRGAFKRGVHVAHLRAQSLEHGKRQTGKGEKPSDRWTLPLCPTHHTLGGRKSQHDYPGGEEKFWSDIGINPFSLCLALRADYEAGGAGVTVLVTAAAAARKSIA